MCKRNIIIYVIFGLLLILAAYFVFNAASQKNMMYNDYTLEKVEYGKCTYIVINSYSSLHGAVKGSHFIHDPDCKNVSHIK